MRPFVRNALPIEKHIFNYRLSRARRVVENAFGILANHWRLYHHCLYLNPDNVTTVVDNRAKIFNDAFEDLTKQGN